jgi:hypothetical protein
METTRSAVAGGAPGDFMTVRHLVLRGTQREIGRALAEEALATFPAVPPPDDPIVNRARRRWVERHWPEHYARMEGIAEAQGIDLLDDRTSAVDLAATPFRPGCSALWCPPAATDDRHPRVGRNFDFRIDSALAVAGLGDVDDGQPPMFSLPYVVETHPNGGMASIVIAGCDLSGCFEGINEAGLTILLLADDESDNLRPAFQLQAGVNEIQLGRFLLDRCRDVEEAIETLYMTKQYDTMFTCHYLVVDRHGEAFVWERDTHNAEHVVRAGASPLCVTNYLLHRHPSPRSLPSSDPRRPDSLPFTTDFYERSRTLDRHAMHTPISVVGLEAALDDVAMGVDVPGARTLWRSIFDPEARSMSVEFYLGDAPDGRVRRSPQVTCSMGRAHAVAS